MRVLKLCSSALLALFFFHSLSLPQEAAVISRSAEPVVIQRLNGPVNFDGLSDEEAWKNIQPLPLVTHMPNFGLPPSERTEILIGFDDEYLWMAGRLYDREPAKINSTSKKRDYFEANTDWFGVIFDTFNDKENALGFFTTPSGLRWDGAVYNDGVPITPTEMPINASWNTFWDVKVVINNQGWFLEMRIPFSSLRFQDKEGRVVMGLIAFRWIARKNEQLIFPAIPPNWGGMSAWKPSQAQEIVLEGVRSRRPLYVTPYGLGGYGHTYDLNEAETAYLRTENPTTEIGLDLKYGLTSNLTLDVTLNPDFAQVEADDQQINLTRFSLFFPEKRLFFQERSSIFDFRFGTYSYLFYSRRIGLYESEDEEGEGQIVPIYGGARVIGRLGSWDLGFLDMQTAPLRSQGLPSENSGVLRVRRRVFNPYSYVGGMITSRIGDDGTYNEVYGFDGIIRAFGDDYLQFSLAQSFENGKSNNPASLNPTRLMITWDRRTQKGLGYHLGVSRAGQDYSPGLGFEMHEDFWAWRINALYGWLPGEKSFLQSHNIGMEAYAYFRNEDSSLETAEAGPQWEFVTKSGFSGFLAYKFYGESVREAFDLSDEAGVPPGEYDFSGVEAFFMTPQGKRFSTMAMVTAGSFYDGRRASLILRPIWGISPTLSLNGMYEYDYVKFPERSQKFIAHLVQAKVTATFTTTFSAASFIQYNSAIDAVIVNLRFRINPREGNDFYIVYNDYLNTDRTKEFPVLPRSSSRALLVKYSYTFNW